MRNLLTCVNYPKESFHNIIHLGHACTQRLGHNYPSMDQVVRKLELVQEEVLKSDVHEEVDLTFDNQDIMDKNTSTPFTMSDNSLTINESFVVPVSLVYGMQR